jgi:hypothetical protein
MDFHNNICGQNLSVLKDNCERSCLRALKNGKLKVLSKDKWLDY